MKKYAIELKWGVIFAIIMLLWMILEKFLGWHDEKIDKHPFLTNLFAIPAILIYIFALLDKRKNYYGGKMTWLQGFLCGVIIAVVVAILSPLVQYVSLNYISPDYFANAIDYAVEAQKMERLEAEQYFTMSNYIVQGEIGSLALGAITGAIVAIFVRKK